METEKIGRAYLMSERLRYWYLKEVQILFVQTVNDSKSIRAFKYLGSVVEKESCMKNEVKKELVC